MKTTTKCILQVLLFCLLAAMLSLGTAIATSAAEITSGSLDISTTYTIGAENSGYTLVYNNGEWKIQRDRNQYYCYAIADRTGNFSVDFSQNNATVFFPQGNISESGITLKCTVADGRVTKDGFVKYDETRGIQVSSETNNKIRLFEKVNSGTDKELGYSKQIEKLNSDENDYSYRLHLTVNGESLTDYLPPSSQKKRKVGIIIDATETMNADGMSGADASRKKYGLAYDWLFGTEDSPEDGSAKELFADGNTEVEIIFINGVGGNSVSYTTIYATASEQRITSYESAQDGSIKNKWDEQNSSHNISYNTAWKAVETEFSSELENNEDLSLVFIVGNAPKTYLNLETGLSESVPPDVEKKNQNDGVAWMESHPNVTLYGLGMVSQSAEDIERGSTEITAIAEASGGYYRKAGSKSVFSDVFADIVNDVVTYDTTSNLVVTDYLSDNVVLAANPETAATLTIGDTANDVSSLVTINGKTISFSCPAEIKGKFKLEIAFNIKTADGVTSSAGYPNTGDEGTDYKNNTTSSGKPGFFSNEETSGISYTINSTDKTGTFKRPVVQAPKQVVYGYYKFTYDDRDPNHYYGKELNQNEYFASTEWTKTVKVALTEDEINGYWGNENHPGVPTYIGENGEPAPKLLAAALSVTGNEYPYDNVSFYKHDIEWRLQDTSTMTADEESKTLTVRAITKEKTFKFKYVINQGDTPTEGAANIKYAENVTFNPAYKGQDGIHVIEGVTLPEDLTYWSSDAEGNDILTTVKTFGMLIRGGYTENDLKKDVVTVYAQTKAPEGDDFQPFIEEATLTRVIADNDVNRYYADYMVDYLNINGDVVQDMIAEDQNVSYGLIVMIADKDETVDQAKMISSLDKLKTNDKTSAYIGDANHFAAYFEYADIAHISDYNRTLFTIDGKYETLKGKRITAMAYIIVQDADSENKKYYYTPVNTDIFVKKDD